MRGEPVLQRVIPRLRAHQTGKEGRLCSHRLMGRQQSPGLLPTVRRVSSVYLHTEDSKETRLDSGSGNPASSILDCSHMLAAQDGGLGCKKRPRKEASLCLGQSGSRPHLCCRGTWYLVPRSLGQMQRGDTVGTEGKDRALPQEGTRWHEYRWGLGLAGQRKERPLGAPFWESPKG